MAFKKLEAPPVPPCKKFVPSPQQAAIFTAMGEPQHLIVQALAGSGKTESLIQGLKRLPQSIRSRIGFCAFNKSIAAELKARVPPGVIAATMHTMGLQALNRHLGEFDLDFDKVDKILDDLTNRKLVGFEKRAVGKLVSLCKAFLMDGEDESLLADLSVQYDIDVRPSLYDLVPEVLTECETRLDAIDFDDMLWLPIVLDVNCKQFDTLCVDEAQDTNICQQELALRFADRLILAGDSRQAIYHFRGADSAAMERMAERLIEWGSEKPSLTTLPLTVTRRCPQSHVALTNRLVPELEALPETGEGVIETSSPEKILREAEPGWMVLCRTNAPLVSGAYSLLKEDRKAIIQGRDIGQGLEALLNRLKPVDVEDAYRKLTSFEDRERGRIQTKGGWSQDYLLAALADKCDCLRTCCNGLDTANEVKARIRSLFSDIDSAHPAGSAVVFSTVHKAKGTEADTVAILRTDQMPCTWSKDQQGELNIIYVAITRSRHRLIFADALPKPLGFDKLTPRR
jgi:DNA helicase-2/ATP-dependent DNA helicase PcrA